MDDFSWVKPATASLANLFGLNPELAAKGRNMQSENDLLLARTANTQADTALSPYRQKVLEAQAAERAAMGGRHNADASKIGSEKALLDYELKARTGMAQAFLNGITRNPDGSVTMSPEAANQAMSGLASFAKNPEQFAEAGRVMMGNVSKIPREQSRLYKAPGSLESDAAYTAKEGQDIEAAKEAARTDRAVKVAETRGTIAQNIGGAPRAIDLTRAANDAVKIGPEYIQSRYGQAGTSLTGSDKPFPIPEDLSFQITNAAQQKYPQLPINQAIDKVIAESGITFDTRGNFNPFISNETRAYARPNSNPQSDVALIGSDEKGMTLADVFARSGVAPAAAPAAPAPAPAAPAAPRSTAPDTHKGAPYYSKTEAYDQPAPVAPVTKAPAIPIYTPGQGMPPYRKEAPAAPAAPAAQGMPDKAQFAAMPEGATVVVKGVKYVKQGRQLVKAQ